MELCKICNTEFNNLGAHLNKKHSMNRQEYELYLVGDFKSETEEVIEEVDSVEEVVEGNSNDSTEEKDSISGKELTENRFNLNKEPDITLKDFCLKNNITEKDLRQLIKQYKGESVVPASQLIKERVDSGDKGAKAIASDYSGGEVEVTDLYVAESLVRQFGFTCDRIERKIPKTWVLKK